MPSHKELQQLQQNYSLNLFVYTYGTRFDFIIG